MTTVPASLGDVVGRVECRVRTLLEPERARWSAVDPSWPSRSRPSSASVLAGGKRLRPAFVHWGFVGAGGEPGDARLDRRRRRLRAAPRLRAPPRRRDGRLAPPDGARRAIHVASPTPRRRRAGAARPAASARGWPILVGDLAFVYADRSCRRRPPTAAGDLERAAHRAQHRPVPRPRRRRPAASATAPRPGASRVQVGQVHRRAAAAPRRRAWPRRGATTLRGRFGATACRWARPSSSATTCSAPSATRRVTGKPVGDDLREGKPTPLLAVATERAARAARPRVLGRVGGADADRRRRRRRPDVLVDTGALAEVEDRDRAADRRGPRRRSRSRPITDEARGARRAAPTYVAWRER